MPRPLSTSIHDHVVEWRALPWPLAWDEVFGRAAELVLEIGFGNGEFLVDQARRHPERDHVGIELSWSAASRLLKRTRTGSFPNLRLLLGDAEVALRHLIAPRSLAEVFVNHPCPWPKERHHSRRLLHPAGMDLLADRMRASAKLTVATDHVELAQWLTEVFAGQTALASCHPTAHVAEIPGRLQTKYERKALSQGERIHYFEWRRTRSAVDAPRPTPSTGPMPSCTLRGRFDGASLFSGFEPLRFREQHEGQEVVLRLTAAYRQVEGDAWLVEVLALEGRLRQEFGILIAERGQEELLVKLSRLGNPYPTHGAKRAVFLVADWLRGRHPGLAIVHENLGALARSPLARDGDEASS